MFSLKSDIYIFILGATLYCLLEILWRGYSHISMFILGGFCCLILYKIAPLPYSTLLLSFIGCLIITFFELICGLLVNKVLQLNVWDYSTVPFNLFGQVCPLYSLIWFVLSYIAIILLRKFVFI